MSGTRKAPGSSEQMRSLGAFLSAVQTVVDLGWSKDITYKVFVTLTDDFGRPVMGVVRSPQEEEMTRKIPVRVRTRQRASEGDPYSTVLMTEEQALRYGDIVGDAQEAERSKREERRRNKVTNSTNESPSRWIIPVRMEERIELFVFGKDEARIQLVGFQDVEMDRPPELGLRLTRSELSELSMHLDSAMRLMSRWHNEAEFRKAQEQQQLEVAKEEARYGLDEEAASQH